MSINAYVLVETEMGKAREALKIIAGIKEVVKVETVTGPYDIIAE